MEGRTWNVFVVEADSPVRKSLKLALEPELSELSERRFGYEAERRSHFVADAGLLRTAILLISRKSSQGWNGGYVLMLACSDLGNLLRRRVEHRIICVYIL
jgi:hypothetical protein